MPARKKPTKEAGAPPATGRKKATARTAVTKSRTRQPKAQPARENSEKRTQDLIIVESPTKAKTINKYLGSSFKVLASYGHVRDLPRNRRRGAGEAIAGVDINAGWVPTYVVVDREDSKGRGKGSRRSAREILAELKREAARSRHVYLATDPDREGEAIAWHIEDALNLDNERTFRITFNEITRSAVQHAIAHPGKIDMDRVRAQEARRILDRVVGYPLTGLLRNKVAPGSTAGRVQSVALRLVVDREREIEAFKPTEYWKILALLAPEGTVSLAPRPFEVVLSKTKGAPAADGVEAEKDGQKPEKGGKKAAGPDIPEGSFLAELAEWAGKKLEVGSEPEARSIAALLDSARYTVASVEQKDRQEKPQPPFTTSQMQQQANIRLHFTGERTMRTAQKLYEGVDLGSEGAVALITYMRTDSTRVSSEALQAVRSHIEASYGVHYLPEKPHTYASGKSAQEAHEAIRPTDLSYTPERVARLGLQGDQLRLYTLIYQRFVASQMRPAIFAVTNVTIQATPKQGADRGVFKAQGKILKFDGYRKVLPPGGKQEDALLPPLAPEQVLDRLGLTASQHYTQPPPRYNEASLIRALEKEGIGRPSTYASIIHKITSEDRGYIEVRERRFHATELGKIVTDLLVDHFPRIMDLKFTSHMEEELDEIETKKMRYKDVLDEFWGPFSAALQEAEAKMPAKRNAETGENCPECGRPLVRKYTKKMHREFIGCSGYKEGCKYIKPREGEAPRAAPVETEHKCPTCGKAMIQMEGPMSGVFLRCSGYPACETKMKYNEEGKPVVSAQATEHICEKCGQPMILRQGRSGMFLGCKGYPKCKNTKEVDANGNPVQPIDAGIACEKCGSPMVVKRGPRGPFLGCSAYPKCRSTKPVPEDMKEELKDRMPAPPKKQVPDVEVHDTCPECGGAMKLRASKRGFFLGCTKFPRCRGTREASPDLLEQLQESGASS